MGFGGYSPSLPTSSHSFLLGAVERARRSGPDDHDEVAA